MSDKSLVKENLLVAHPSTLVEAEVEIGPARQVGVGRPSALAQAQASDSALSSASPFVEPFVKSESPTEPEQVRPAVAADEYAVTAPYWLDGLHNFEGIELAKQINRLIDAENLVKNKAGIATLLATYPESRRLGVSLVSRSIYLNDEEKKKNVSEPTTLLGGELIRDNDSGYRPKAGGLPVLKDQGTSVVLKNKSALAYRGAMELALLKGWVALEVKGNPQMVAQAWLEAKLMGLEVINFQPTDQDREKLAQRMAEEVKKRDAAAARTEEQAPEEIEVTPIVGATRAEAVSPVEQTTARAVAQPLCDVSPADDGGALVSAPSQVKPTHKGKPSGHSVAEKAVAPAVAPTGARRKRTRPVAPAVAEVLNQGVSETELGHTPAAPKDGQQKPVGSGRLLAHGRAPYERNPENNGSYFVDLLTAEGVVKTVWGKDLERSIADVGARLGDTISMAENGRVPVVVGGKNGHRVNWLTTVVSREGQLPAGEGQSETRLSDVVGNGLHVGEIVRAEGGSIAQKVGRDPSKLVWHDISKLDGKVPTVGEWAEIQYGKDGIRVKTLDQTQGLGR